MASTTAGLQRVHGAILGYKPMRMKPVHFATSFILAVTGRHSTLEILNKASNPKAAPKNRDRVDEYTIEDLHPRLVDEGRLNADIDRDAFRLLRSHLNVAFTTMVPRWGLHLRPTVRSEQTTAPLRRST